jgi:hypothetical protein
VGFSRTKVKTDEASFSDAVEEKPLFEADFLGRETFLNDCFAIRYMFERFKTQKTENAKTSSFALINQTYLQATRM